MRWIEKLYIHDGDFCACPLISSWIREDVDSKTVGYKTKGFKRHFKVKWACWNWFYNGFSNTFSLFNISFVHILILSYNSLEFKCLFLLCIPYFINKLRKFLYWKLNIKGYFIFTTMPLFTSWNIKILIFAFK